MIEEKLDTLIYEVRGKKVVLVRDLAKLYSYKNGTKTINLTIKRNIEKFSSENYFQLTNEESDVIRFQCETKKGFTETRGGNFDKPFVLTKDGILTLSKLIKKENIALINSQLLKEFDDANLTKNELSNYQILPNNQEKIESLIYEVRGVQVMLDSDVAKLYHVETKRINEVIKRNLKRFPESFCFQLTDEEFSILRSQIATSNKTGSGGIRYLPYVLTEQGIMMLSGLLKSDIAVKVNVLIIDAFVKLRKYISNNLISNEMYLNHENRILKLEDMLDKMQEKEKINTIFFDGQIYDAYSKILDILNSAKKDLIIIDPYADKKILDMISNVKVKVTLITMKDRNLKQSSIDNYNKQYDNLNVINDYTFHDRYIIIDKKEIYHSGASLTGAGKKTFSIDKYEEPDAIKLLLDKVDKITEKDDLKI